MFLGLYPRSFTRHRLDLLSKFLDFLHYPRVSGKISSQKVAKQFGNGIDMRFGERAYEFRSLSGIQALKEQYNITVSLQEGRGWHIT